MECPARHLQDSPGLERNFLDMRARAVSRPAITAGGDGFGRHRLSHGGACVELRDPRGRRQRLPHDGEARIEPRDPRRRQQRFPVMGERTVSRSASTAGDSAFPVIGEHEVSRAAPEASGSAFKCFLERPRRAEGARAPPCWRRRTARAV